MKNFKLKRYNRLMTPHIINYDSKYNIIYDNSDILGEGNYAKIYRAHLMRKKKHHHLFICHRDLEEIGLIVLKITKKKQEALALEIKCLLELKDEPHIIHISEIAENKRGIFRKYEFIGLEYCDGGDLFDYFVRRNRQLTESELKIIFRELGEAVRECHRHGIVHGDIKLENIGLTQGRIKLLDFGGAHIITRPDDETEHEAWEFQIFGTLHYMGPELVAPYKIKERELIYTDLWKLGVLCYVLLTGEYPFDAPDANSLFQQILKKKIKWGSRKIPLELKKFTESLLVKTPKNRILLSI